MARKKPATKKPTTTKPVAKRTTTKSTAKCPTRTRRIARRVAVRASGVKKGDMALERHGQLWEPIACGVHRSIPPHESTGAGMKVVHHNRRPHLEPPVADGFQPNCADCQAELESTVESADRHATV